MKRRWYNGTVHYQTPALAGEGEKGEGGRDRRGGERKKKKNGIERKDRKKNTGKETRKE